MFILFMRNTMYTCVVFSNKVHRPLWYLFYYDKKFVVSDLVLSEKVDHNLAKANTKADTHHKTIAWHGPGSRKGLFASRPIADPPLLAHLK